VNLRPYAGYNSLGHVSFVLTFNRVSESGPSARGHVLRMFLPRGGPVHAQLTPKAPHPPAASSASQRSTSPG
jgi:hypothetical protein